jgi:hypothetical protein
MQCNIIKQGYVAPMLTLPLQTAYARHHELVVRYEIFISQMTMDYFPL